VYRYRIPIPVLTWLDDRHITTVIAKPPPFIHQVAGTSYLLTECISDLHLLGRNIGTVTRAHELDARDSPRIVGDYAGLSQHINVLTVVMCLPFMNLTRQYTPVYFTKYTRTFCLAVIYIVQLIWPGIRVIKPAI